MAAGAPNPGQGCPAFTRRALRRGAEVELVGARGESGAQGSSTKPSLGTGFGAGGHSSATGAVAQGCRQVRCSNRCCWKER